jgi:hypothetical protein
MSAIAANRGQPRCCTGRRYDRGRPWRRRPIDELPAVTEVDRRDADHVAAGVAYSPDRSFVLGGVHVASDDAGALAAEELGYRTTLASRGSGDQYDLSAESIRHGVSVLADPTGPRAAANLIVLLTPDVFAPDRSVCCRPADDHRRALPSKYVSCLRRSTGASSDPDISIYRRS